MASVIKDLITKRVIRSVSHPENLYQLAANLPKDGVGQRVVPVTWIKYNVEKEPDHFFTITHVRLTPGMTQGIISGIRTWQGKAEKTIVPIPQELATQKWRAIDWAGRLWRQ